MLYKKLISFITISLLLIPLPVLAEDVIGEVTVSEDFSDSTYQTGLTISGGNIQLNIIIQIVQMKL